MRRGLRLGAVANGNGILNALRSSGIRFWVMMVMMMVSGVTWGQFSESMGTTASNGAAISTYTGFQNNGSLSFSGSAVLRTSTTSSGYTGASGSINVSFGAFDRDFIIDNINASSYTGLVLSFGLNKVTAASNTNFKISYSTTGPSGTFTDIPITLSGSTWALYSSSTTIPNGVTTIRFHRNSTGTSGWDFRLDDVKLTGTIAGNTVTFNGNGSTGGTTANQTASTTTALTTNGFTRTGYIFTGWNTAADGSGTAYTNGASYPFTASTTLYAQWAATYPVTYSGNTQNSGTAPTDVSSPYTAGVTVTVLGNTGTLVKTGYTFSGWNTAANGSGTDRAVGATFSMPSSATTLYAKWTINNYSLTYNGNGSDGGTAPITQNGNYNTNLTVSPVGTLTRNGYSFNGWNTAANGSGTSYAAGSNYTIPATNNTLYAQWTNLAPIATSVNITGTLVVGQLLTGNYTYVDTDPQGTSTFKWYRADDASGTGEVAIAGATANTYTLTVGDFGKHIRFSVVPVATAGTLTGIETFSARVGAVAAGASPLANLSGTLAEATLNTDAVQIDLTNTSFADGVLDPANFTLNNAPAGMAIDDVLYDNSTSVLISFTYDNTDFDADITNFSITIAGSELATGSPLTTNATTITATIETLNVGAMSAGFGNQCINQASGQQTFTLSGTNLKSGNISLAALAGFAYSEVSGGPYTSTLSFVHAGGNLSGKTIYVVFTPTLVQSYDGNIALSGAGAPFVNRSVTGSGVNNSPAITTPTSTSITATTATLGGNITSIGCSNVTERGVFWSTTNGFADGAGTKVSITAGPYGTGVFTQAVTGLPTGTTIYFKAFATNSGGTVYTSQASFATLTPTITLNPVTPALTGFTYVLGSGPSTEQSFTVSGTNLVSAITVAPSASYEISTTPGSGFGSSITLAPTSETVTATTIYVRLKAGLAVNSYNAETITSSATGATSKSATCSGTVTPVPPSNDNCAGATGITIGAAAIGGTLVASTPQSSFTENDVWYSFTPSCTTSHTVTVSNFGSSDLGFTVYASSCPANASATKFVEKDGSTATETDTRGYTGGITYYIRVWKYDGADTTFNILVNSATPATPGTISGSTTPCIGVPVTYSITTVANATGYTWTFPSGWTVDTPSTTNTITVTPGSTTGNVSVTANNCYASSIARTLAITSVITIPSQPLAISGPITVCSESAGNTYSIASVSGATSYTWALPGGWSGTSTTNSITVTAGSTGGNITVSANNTCGSSSTQTLAVAVTSVAAPTGTISVAGSGCDTTTLAYSAPSANLYWQTSSTGTSTANPTTSNYGATASSPVYVRNFDGSCWSVGNVTFTPTVNTTPSISIQPTSQFVLTGTTATFSVTATGTISSYQWQVNTGSGFTNVSTGSGGTTASYTTAATSLAMNGYTYQCIINGTPPCGNIVSATVTLSVVNEIYGYNNFLSTTGTGSYTTASSWCQCKNASGCIGTTPNSGGWGALGADGAPGASHTVFVQGNITGASSGVANATILSGGTLTTSGNYPVSSSLKVKTGGQLNVNSNLNFSSSSATFTIEANAGVTLNTTYSAPATSIWNGIEDFDAESTVKITNWSSSATLLSYSSGTPAITPKTQNGYTAIFGYLIIDTTLGNNWALLPVNANFNITHNDFSIKNNNTAASGQNITLFSGNTNTLGVGRDFIANTPAASSIQYQSGNGSPVFNIKRDLIKNGTGTGEFRFFAGISTKGTLNIDRDFIINEGIFNLQSGTSTSTSTYETNLKGNLTVATNAVLRNGNTHVSSYPNSSFNFTGTSSIQTIDIASTGTNENSHIYFYIKSGASVKLINRNLELGTNSKLTVEDGGTLDFGFGGATPLNLTISNSQTGTAFQSDAGSILKITSAQGITTSGTTGNVQTTSRTYATTAPYADYYYIGKTNQNTGNGLPANARNLTLNNEGATNDITLTQAVTVQNTLTMTHGNVVATTSNLLELGSGTGNTGTLAYTSGYVKGPMKRWFSGTNTGNATGLFPFGTAGNLNRFARIEYTTGPTAGALTLLNNSTPMGKAGLAALPLIAATGSCTTFEVLSTDDSFWEPVTAATTISGGTYTATLQKESTSTDAICKHTLLKKDATNWLAPGTHIEPSGTPANIIVQRTGLNGNAFSLGIGNGFCPKTPYVYNGAWPGSVLPTRFDSIEIQSDLELASGIINGCECKVDDAATLTIKSGATLQLEYGLTVKNAGDFIIEDTGSLVQINDVDNATANNNTGSIKMHRYTKPLYRYDFTYWSSPVSGTTLHDLSPMTLFDKFFKWNDAWVSIPHGTESMSAGTGYIVRAPQNYPVEGATGNPAPITYQGGVFTGRPNNGVVKHTVTGGTAKWNLLGNPYPSAISGEAFLNANSTHPGNTNDILGGTLYFWTHNTAMVATEPGSQIYTYNSGDYASWNSSGGTGTTSGEGVVNATDPSGYIAAGQAFFVAGTVSGEAVFNNTMRVTGNNDQFFRPAQPEPINNWDMTGKHRVWLNMKGQTKGFNQLLVGYIENATDGLDTRFDGESFGGNQVTFYSLLDTKKLVIQGRALPFNNQDQVPLGYKSTLNGTLTISIDHYDGLFEGQDIYLEDKSLNIVHDLKASAYSFASVAGTFNERFVLRFLPSETLGNPDHENIANGVILYQENGKIMIKSQLEALEQVTVYDLLGRNVFDKANIGQNEFGIQNVVMNEQPLIVKIRLANGQVVNKKIVY